jgi:two-component system sensor kinase FixL
MPPPKPTSVADALQALGLNEARWQAVLDSVQDAIISIDQRGTVTLFNRAAERIFGYAADAVVGRNVTMLMPPPYHDEHAQYVERYERTGVAKAIGRIRDVHARRQSGEVFPIELSVSEARLGEDRIYTAIIRDVSDRVHTQAQLHELEQRARQRDRLADIGAITAKVVHDLGNPLAAISMQAQLLVRRLHKGRITTDDSLLPTAERVLASVHRLDTMIHEFSSVAREQRLDFTEVVLSDVLRDLRDLWFPLASSRAIDLVLDLPPQCPPLRADEQKLRRVFENLVKNAIEAIDCGPGRVTVLTRAIPTDEKVRISIADTGPGIPPSIDVFGLFETTKSDGTGLGLAVAHQIVVAHGGTIQHEQLAPTGTAFHIELPVRGPAVRGHAGAVAR